MSTEKERLLREIRDLKSMIKEYEWNLETLRFKDVERHYAAELQSLKSKRPLRHRKIPNVEVELQNDLYRFGGLYCTQARRQELVFNFSSSRQQHKDNTYMVQILLKDEKASLGKWVMPMSIDMSEILEKTPLDNINTLSSFIKNCKHHVDCYAARKEQFELLKVCVFCESER